MRIDNIRLLNYRQFRDVEISFTSQKKHDLHLIIGKNGSGKTNFLNALNWCLYGDEPHLSIQSKLLPLLNLNAISSAEEGADINVEVEVRFVKEQVYICFVRKAIFKIFKSEDFPVHQSTEFEATISAEDMNSKILNEEEAKIQLERFIPSGIRDYFFFDGERLDNYFKEAKGQNIRDAIITISQIELLESKIEPRLDDILKELRRAAGRMNPKLDNTTQLLEEAKDRYKNLKKEIQGCHKEIAISKKGMENCDRNLKGVPDIERIEQELHQLRADKKHTKEFIKEYIGKKANILFDSSICVQLAPSFQYSLQVVKEKRINKEIPPPASPVLLESSLKNNQCTICARELDSNAKNHVEEMLQEIKLSSEIANQLINIEYPLKNCLDRLKHNLKELHELTRSIDSKEKELDKIEERMDQIEKILKQCNVENVRKWFEQRKGYEEEHGKKQRQLGVLEERQKKLQEKIAELENEFNEEMKKEVKNKELSKQINFCKKSLEIVTKTKEVIMHETKKKIESKTKDLFFELIWKKETFADIEISDDFDINLIHFMGYSCLGSISAAERELLALSFTLALHDVSGFESPIIIDTPVARVSDENRENLGKVFSNVSKDKQTILLFTPSEYSDDISKEIERIRSNKYVFNLSAAENEVVLKEEKYV